MLGSEHMETHTHTTSYRDNQKSMKFHLESVKITIFMSRKDVNLAYNMYTRIMQEIIK